MDPLSFAIWLAISVAWTWFIWFRTPGKKRKPRELPATYDPWFAIRPELGSDTPGGCLHLKPEPVIITGETTPIGWICSDCLVDLNGDHAAVTAYIKEREAASLKEALNRDFSQMFMPPSLAEREKAARMDDLKERLLRQEKVMYGQMSFPTDEYVEIRDGAGNLVKRVEY